MDDINNSWKDELSHWSTRSYMDVVKPIWRFRPPPENAGVLEMCRLGPRNCPFGNACPKAHFSEEMHEWHLRISFQIHQKMRSVAERKFQSPIDSVRNLINEGRRLGLPQKNMVSKKIIPSWCIREASNIRFYQKDVNMTSGGERFNRHDVFFSRNN